MFNARAEQSREARAEGHRLRKRFASCELIIAQRTW
jgi:hypothetical protein